MRVWNDLTSELSQNGWYLLFFHTVGVYILWRIKPLLGNDPVNTIPLKPTRTTVWRLLLGNGSVSIHRTVRDNRRRCFPRSPYRSYITGSLEGAVVVRSWESSVEEFIWVSCQEFGRVLEMAVEDDWEEIARKDLGAAKKTSCVIWIDRLLYIRCQDATSKTEKPSACVTVNCEVCRSAIALYCL
jgi:hypothetical protein